MSRQFFPLFLSAVCCVSCSTSPTEPVAVQVGSPMGPVSPVTRPVLATRLTGSSATLVVHGLSCPSCANAVGRQLHQIPGIRTVDVDPSEGITEITYDPAQPPTQQEVKDAVRWGGAILVEVRNP